MRYWLIGILSLYSLGGFCQTVPSSAKSASKHARKQARLQRAYNGVFATPDADWKGWLDKNFPDASAGWPDAAKRAFAAVSGDGKWAYVGKGNIDRDGAPTALMVRFKDAPQQGYLVVDRLVVSKWADGKWNELLRADAGDGLTVNGIKPGALQSPVFSGYEVEFFAGNPENTKHPGMWITLKAVDKDGNALTEDADFFYVPKSKKYGGSSY